MFAMSGLPIRSSRVLSSSVGVSSAQDSAISCRCSFDQAMRNGQAPTVERWLPLARRRHGSLRETIASKSISEAFEHVLPHRLQAGRATSQVRGVGVPTRAFHIVVEISDAQPHVREGEACPGVQQHST